MEYLSAKYNADLLTVDYLAGDGSHLLRTGGTAAWRFNNPGNLRPGRGGKILYGAIGIAKTKTNNSFLIFSSYEEGRKQKKLLLRRKYNARTIYTMLAGIEDKDGNTHDGYAPQSDNNDPHAYASAIATHIGKPIDTRLSDLTDAELESMMDAMEKKEGYHGKRETRQERLVPSTAITLSDGARPQADMPAKLQVGDKEIISKTDKEGRLPPVPHVSPGSALSVSVIDLEGQWKKIYEGVLGAKSQVLGLFNTFEVFSAPTAPRKPPQPARKPRRVPVRYVVELDDTLGKIAERFTTTVAEIRRDNPQIKDVSKIYPGQVLSIYGQGAAPAPRKKAAAAAAPAPARARPRTAPPARPTTPARSKEGSGAPLALVAPDQKLAPWMLVAVAEARKWGGKTEGDITKTSNYHKLNGTTFLPSLVGTNNAWCASFVNYCLRTAATPYKTWKNSFRARAVALDANFVEIDKPVFGAVMLVGTHHVALVYAKNGSGVISLGGNQSDQINFSPFSKSLRFFVPLAYHRFAQQEIARGAVLPTHTADELNAAFGIKMKKKKGNATR